MSLSSLSSTEAKIEEQSVNFTSAPPPGFASSSFPPPPPMFPGIPSPYYSALWSQPGLFITLICDCLVSKKSDQYA